MSPDTELRTPAPPPDWITEQALLKEIETRGLTRPEKSQLRRWGRRGLIASARQCWTPGESGSCSYYPPETVEQLARLLELRGDRRLSLDHLLFELWWEGREVGAEQLRRFLSEVSRETVSKFVELRRICPDPLNLADAVTKEVEQEPVRAPLPRLIKHRLGRNDADLLSFIWTLSAMAAGGTPLEISEDEPKEEPCLETRERSRREILEIGMGAESAGGWLTDSSELSSVFSELAASGFLDPERVAEAFLRVTDAELAAARSTAHDMLSLGAYADAVEVITGQRDALGFGFLSVLHRARAESKTRVMALSIARCLLQMGFDKQMEEIFGAIRGTAPQISQFADLVREFPELRAAIPTLEEIAALESLPKPKQRKMQEEMKRALGANPEIAARLGIPNPEQEN